MKKLELYVNSAERELAKNVQELQNEWQETWEEYRKKNCDEVGSDEFHPYIIRDGFYPNYLSQNPKILFIAFGKPAEGKDILLFQKIEGMADGLDKDRGDIQRGTGHPPQRTQLPPADGHGVVGGNGASGEQSPFVVEETKNIGCQIKRTTHSVSPY